MRTLVFFILALFLSSCNSTPSPKQTIKTNSYQEQLNQKFQNAYENSDELLEKHSKWYDRKEKLPLTITLGYIDPQTVKTQTFHYYTKILQLIKNNPSFLGNDLQKLYNSISIAPLKKHQQKFLTAYQHRDNEKEVLIDILRPSKDSPTQELFIALDYDDLRKGNLTLHGYKYVKQKDKLPNAYYYTLTKTGYKKLSKKQQKEAILNSIQAILTLSIPEYISVDRKKLIGDTKKFTFNICYPDGLIEQKTYTNKTLSSIKKIQSNLVKFSKTLQGHTDSVKAIAISTDGKYALSGSDDKTLHYWDLKTGKTLKILKGHTDSITSVAISTDGKYALSGSDDKTLRYWDLKTGKTIKVLKGDSFFGITTIAISPNGKYALSGSWNDLSYWDLNSGKIIKILKGHTNFITSVTFSPDGKYALSGSEDGTLYYWDLNSGKIIKILKEKNFVAIKTVAISPSGKYALSGSLNNISYWDLKSGKIIKILKGHTSFINSLTFSPNGRYALSGSDDKTLHYWNLQTGEIIFSLYSTNRIHSIALHQFKNDITILCDKKEKISIYRNNHSKQNKIQLIKKLSKYQDTLYIQKLLTSSFSQKDIYSLYKYHYINSYKKDFSTIKEISTTLNYTLFDPIILSTLKKYSYLTNVPQPTSLKNKSYTINKLLFSTKLPLTKSGFILQSKVLKQHVKDLTALAISSNNQNILYNNSNNIYYWNFKANKNIKILKGHKNNITSVAISSDGKYALSGSWDHTIRLWDLKSGKTIRILKGHIKAITSIVVSPDGKYAISASYDKTLRYWNLQSGKTIKILKGHTGPIYSIAISPNGKYILSGGTDETLRYWDLKSGKTIKILKGHKNNIASVAISPDGKYALSGSWDHTIRLWDLKSGKTIRILKGHTHWISSVAFSPDNNHAISGSYNHTLRYWDLKTGKTLKKFKGHTEKITSIIFSSDGKYALSASTDGTIRYWNLEE